MIPEQEHKDLQHYAWRMAQDYFKERHARQVAYAFDIDLSEEEERAEELRLDCERDAELQKAHKRIFGV